mgnify:CR=1 FL=1
MLEVRDFTVSYGESEVVHQVGFEAGEGDMSLAWWLTAHRQDFAERGEREGFEAHERLELVLEHFERVWPPPALPPGTA